MKRSVVKLIGSELPIVTPRYLSLDAASRRDSKTIGQMRYTVSVKLWRLPVLIFSALMVAACNQSNDDHMPAGPGSLDRTFSNDGKVVVENPGGAAGWDAALQADGKLVMVGSTYAGVTDQAVMIVRLDTKGVLDSTFNGTGKLIFNPTSSQDQAFSVLVQSDGKIVIVGEQNDMNGAMLLVARFNEDGTADMTFDSDGQAVFHIGAGGAVGHVVVQQADDKLVVAGEASNGSDRDFAVVRLNTDGSLDTSFDTDGVATSDFRNTDDLPFAIAIGQDNVITVAGYSVGGAGPHDAAVARFTGTGAPDTTFDTDGEKIFVIGSSLSAFRDLVIQTDGLIVAAGGSVNSGILSYTVARFYTSGMLDSSWGAGGISYVGNIPNSEAFACTMQADGKVLVGGYGYTGGGQDFVLVRLNNNGAADAEFGSAGQVATTFGAGDECIRALVVQSDDRIIAVGNSPSGLVGARYIP